MVKTRVGTVLTIDVGNTSASYALFRGSRMLRSGYTPISSIPNFIYLLLKLNNKSPISYIVFSSVVPEITNKVRTALKRFPKVILWEVGRNLTVPLRHNYKHIKRLGSDRLVTAYGAAKFYRPPLLILDFGTALTCDFVSSKGRFEGGLIIPGPQIAFEALYQRTALLPKLPLPRKAGPLPGRDTVSGMNSGLLYGYAAMADGLAHRFRTHFGRRLKVIATGGFASLIVPYSKEIDRVDPLLTLKSLGLIFRHRQASA